MVRGRMEGTGGRQADPDERCKPTGFGLLLHRISLHYAWTGRCRDEALFFLLLFSVKRKRKGKKRKETKTREYG
jgi:hypothetical protein